MNNLKDKNTNYKKLPALTLILGCLGFVLSAILMVSGYKAANNPTELIKPIIINFIPFAISFILIKIGIKRMTEGKK